MNASKQNFTLSTWERLSARPAGKWLFSRLVSWKAPYFRSIKPSFVELRPGRCEVRIKKRRAVLNHLGTVHAIAMCNMAELAGGTMTEVTVPPDYRWIPKRMTVDYLKTAKSDLSAIAELDRLPAFSTATELPIPVTVQDASQQPVFRAVITMWVSPRK